MSMTNPIPTPEKTPAQELADNIDALHANGYGTLDIPTQVAIASSGNPPTTQFAIADQIKQASANNAVAMDHFYADAQQARVPSAVQKATTAIKGHFGDKLLAVDHVSEIQQQMIKAGYAPKDSKVTGIWTPEWTALASKANYAEMTKPGTGNAPAKSTVQHILGALSLSRNFNVILEVAKSTPRSVMNLIGDSLVGVVPAGAASAVGQLGAKEENRISAEEYKKRALTPGQVFNDAMTLLTFIPMARVAVGAKTAATTAKTGAVLSAAEVAPKYTLLNSIVAAQAAGTTSVVNVSAKAFLNKPILKQIYWGFEKAVAPTIAKTAPIQIAVRDTLAQRLRLPAVRAANQFGLTVLGRGLQEQGIALAESKIGNEDGALTSTVYGVAPISGALAHALDIFAIQMNPGTATSRAATAKNIIGDTAKAGAVFRNALDDMGALVAWQKANPDLDYAEVVANVIARGGDETDILKTIGQQVNEIATQQAMMELRNPLILDGKWGTMTAAEKETWGLTTRNQIYADAGNPNGLLAQARQSLVADQNALETGFRNIGASAAGDVRAISKAGKGTSRFEQQVEANSIMDKIVNGQDSQYFITPELLTKMTTQQVPKVEEILTARKAEPLVTGTPEEISAAQKVLDDATKALNKAKAAAEKTGLKMEGIYKPITQSDIKKGIVTAAQQKAFEAYNAAYRAEREATLAINKVNPKPLSDFVVPTAEIAQEAEAVNKAGSIGIARIETLTKLGANKLFNNLGEKLRDAKTPDAVAKVRTEIANALLNEFGYDVYKLGSYDASELLTVLGTEADKLASDLFVIRDAPKEFLDTIARLKALGYKPVVGTDIGHTYNPAAQFTDLGTSEIKTISKIASKFGLSPRLSNSKAVSARSRVELDRTIQAGIDSGKIEVFPSFNADRLLTYMRSAAEKEVELTWGQNEVLNASRKLGLYDIPIKRLMEAEGYTSSQAWEAILEAKRTELGFREIPYEQLIKILTKPLDEDVALMMGLEKGTPFMSEKSAINTIQAIWKARTNVPTEMIGGLAKVEDFLYAGLGIGNKLSGQSGIKLASVPSTLFNLRSRVRYQLSPLFAYRRMFKTAAKGITENIPPTMYPESKMEEMGIYAQAKKIHERIFPEDATKNAFLDEAERVIRETDFYNLYNTRAAEEWAGYWLAKQGFSDAEIAQKIENVMGYGERTGAERTVNAIFFPFSFNKTVGRQFGAYLLTHPGQVMLTQGIIDFYDKHEGPKLFKWIDENLPIIKEIHKLNPLEHGVGLGGYGGINAPYFQAVVDLLAPKMIDYGTTKHNDGIMTTLNKYIPAIKEFSDLFMTKEGKPGEGEVWASLKTLVNIGEEGKAKLTGSKETLISPRQHGNMPNEAQQTAAWEYRNTLITQLTPYLDYNYKNPNNRIAWPEATKTETGLAGKPINKQTIDELVHYKYPAWDNAASAGISRQKATEANRFIGEIKARDPQRGLNYEVFNKAAVRVSDAVAKDSIPEANLVKITDTFRKVAIDLAEKDPNFAAFYKTHYERLFGPLEGFK